MTTVLFSACVAAERIEEHELRGRIQSLFRFWGIDVGETRNNLFCHGNMAYFYIMPPTSGTDIALSIDNDQFNAVSTHLPWGTCDRYSRNDLESGLWIVHALDDALRYKNLYFQMNPPWSILFYDKKKKFLKLYNDWNRKAKIFEYRLKDACYWSNHSALIAAMSGKDLEVEVMDYASYVEHHLRENTGFKGIKVLEVGTSISANGIDSKIEKRIPHDPRPLFAKRVEATDHVLDETLESLAKTFIDLKSHHSGRFRIGLSGGMDSRLMAALALTNDLDAAFFTIPPQLEIHIARQLVDASPYPMDWHPEKPAAIMLKKAPKTRGQDPMTRIIENFHYYGGYSEPELTRSPKDLFCKPGDFTIIGYPGEVGRSFYYQTGSLQTRLILKRAAKNLIREFLNGPSRQSLDSLMRLAYMDIRKPSLKNTLILGDFLYRRGLHPLLTVEAKRRLITDIKWVFEEAGRYGLSGFFALDWLYMWQRASSYHPASDISEVWPYFNMAYFANGFSQRTDLKAKAAFQKHLTIRCIPQWAGIAYFKDIAFMVPKENVAWITGWHQPILWEPPYRESFFDHLKSYRSYYEDVFVTESLLKAYSRLDREKDSKRYMGLTILAYHSLWAICAQKYARQINSLSRSD